MTDAVMPELGDIYTQRQRFCYSQATPVAWVFQLVRMLGKVSARKATNQRQGLRCPVEVVEHEGRFACEHPAEVTSRNSTFVYIYSHTYTHTFLKTETTRTA